MTSVLIVDSDPVALDMLQRAFHARDSVTCVALDAAEAAERIAHECYESDGLITNVDLVGADNGWSVARLAREANPRITIGYMSAEGHSGWAAYGVPNSVLISKAVDPAEIAATFVRFCESARRSFENLGEAAESAPILSYEVVAPRAPHALVAEIFSSIDWSSTALGPPDTWDGNLRSWVRFMLAISEPLLMVWGPDRVMLFNAPFRAAFGNLFADDLGRPFSPPDWEDWNRCDALTEQALTGQSGALANLRLSSRPDIAADDHFYNLTAAPIQDASGSTISAICQFVDTTEATRAAQTLRRERDGLHALVTQVPGFIAFLEGTEHRFTFANAAYHQLVERDDLLGKPVIEALPELISQGFVEILDRVYRSGEPFVAKGLTASFYGKDGSYTAKIIDFSYNPVRDATGKITGIFVAGHDTTDHHNTQQRIGALQNELIHISRVNAMGMMVSTIAHELNQPLTTIHNYVTVARMIIARETPDPVAIESLEGAADAALRAGDIIRNLRSMMSRREVLREPVPLEETLREAAGLAGLGQTNARIAFHVPARVTVLGDKILIQQILFNLVRNALEAAEGRAIDVTVTAADKGPIVEICVADTGPGIDRTLLSSVFESFVTTKVDGTGIGLSICKAIIEAHGGVISARNGAEGGAVFCFTLPQIG